MGGPGLFLLVCLLLVLTVAGVAVVLRLRTRDRRWAQWEQVAAAPGLQVQVGDPLGLGPVLSAPGRRLTVERTVSGTLAGVPVALVSAVGGAGGPHTRHVRSDAFGLARVATPVPLDRVRAALASSPDVSAGTVGDLVVLEPVRGLRLSVDVPTGEQAARLLDLAVVAGQAAGQALGGTPRG